MVVIKQKQKKTRKKVKVRKKTKINLTIVKSFANAIELYLRPGENKIIFYIHDAVNF